MIRTVLIFLLLSLRSIAAAAEPCQSGPQPGQRTGEYTSLIATGSERGKSHCYICDAGEHPSVIVFARSLNEPLAKLVQGLDKAREDCKDAELHPWVTFLNSDQTAFDPQLVAWGNNSSDGALARAAGHLYSKLVGKNFRGPDDEP